MKKETKEKTKINLANLMTCVVIGFLVYLIPTPAALSSNAWKLFAVFLATISGIILKPMPMGVIALLGLTVATLVNGITPDQAFIGFGSQVVWLVVFAFFIAKGFIVTGLGQRIGLLCIRSFGSHTIGLSYGIALADLIMAPAIPSVSARAAGIIYPIVQGIARSYGSYANDPSAQKIGAFLTLTCFQATVITSAMFMTAMAANPMLAELTGSLGGRELTWGVWAVAAIVPGLLSLLVMPWVVYYFCPPHIRKTPNAALEAQKQLTDLGKISSSEIIMACVMFLMVLLWIFGPGVGISATITAAVGLCILLVTGVLDWDDLLNEKSAWETFIWFSVLLMMARYLNEYGVMEWFSQQCVGMVGHLAWQWGLLILGLVYFYSHYLFASSTVHVSSMYPSFLGVLLVLGAPGMLTVFLLIFASNLFGGLTHYSLTPAPLLYSVGYVDLRTWWKVGFAMSVVNILIWGGIGSMWWKFLGFW